MRKGISRVARLISFYGLIFDVGLHLKNTINIGLGNAIQKLITAIVALDPAGLKKYGITISYIDICFARRSLPEKGRKWLLFCIAEKIDYPKLNKIGEVVLNE